MSAFDVFKKRVPNGTKWYQIMVSNHAKRHI